MLEILNGGTQSTLQDAGRPGHRHAGIPSGGAADRLNFALANWSVGNAWDAVAIECAMGGLHIKFHKDTIISICGAKMWAQINGTSFQNFKPTSVSKGDILTLSYARNGCRAYIAVAGGLKGDNFLGSVATYIPAKIGGLDGTALKAGDHISIADNPYGPTRRFPNGYVPRLSQHIVLRVLAGPEFEQLTPESQRQLFVGLFEATAQTDRMGARIKGANTKDIRILPTEPISMVSSPLLSGTLQVPPDGLPILSLIDGHCTGGYLRALQVIRADLWQMGQIGPGTRVSFRRCFAPEPLQILKGRNAFYGAEYGGLIDGFAF